MHVHPDQAEDAQNHQPQPSRRESNFDDSSGPLFSIYSKIAEEEDSRMGDRWQKDANGILIFVSPQASHPNSYAPKLERCRPVYSPLRSPHYSRCRCRTSDRTLKIPLHSISGIFIGPKRHHTTHVHPFPCGSTTSVLASEIRRLGELTLFSELSYQPYLRSLGNIVTSMCTPIRQGHSAAKVRP